MFKSHNPPQLSLLLSSEAALYRRPRFPLMGLRDPAPTPKATGDSKADGSCLSLTYGDYITRTPPIVFVYTSLPGDQPDLAELLRLEQREAHLAETVPTGQTIVVSMNGARASRECLRAGPLWGFEIVNTSTVVTVFASDWTPPLVELQIVDDVEPYLVGRRRFLERLGPALH